MVRSQAKDAGSELARLQDLLERAIRRGDALETELAHAKSDLAHTDIALDRLGAAFAAAGFETERLKLAAAGLSEDAEVATARIADLKAAVDTRDTTIKAMARLIDARDLELADMRERAALAPAPMGAAAAVPSGEVKTDAALQRRLRNAEEDAALQRALVDLMLGMLQVLASPGRWWTGFLPGFWVRRLKYDRLRRKNLFDAALYSKRYPDVVRARIDPLHHYVSHGLEEGRTRM